MNKYPLSTCAAVLTLLLLTLLIPGSAFARQQAENLIFIFDGSTSMWGRINGEPKLVIAKDAMRGVIDQLPDHVNAGLMSYGHRVERDCTDVEALVPLQPLDRKQLKQQLRDLQPKGRTPITYALQQVFGMLSATGTTSIVLLTDGIENCEGDPCAVVNEARTRGLDFNLHVIGFDVPEEESADLQCSATAGNGLYMTADDSDQLVTALDNAVREEITPMTPGAGRSITATEKTPTEPARLSERAAPEPTANVTETAAPETTTPIVTALATGMGTADTRTDTVPDSSQTDHHATSTDMKMEPPDADADVDADAETETSGNPEPTSTSEQNVAATTEPAPSTQETEPPATTTVTALNLVTEQSAGASLEAPTEVLANSAFEVKWNGPGDDWDYVTTVEANADEGSYTHYTYTKEGNPLMLQAPAVPGDYEIRYVEGATQNTLARATISVR